jgi:hypothetical protein
MKKNKLKLKFLLPFFVACFLFVSQIVQAAELKLNSSSEEFGVNKTFQVDFVLNAEGESINALEGQILFPADLLELKEVREANSIISFWIEQPRVGEAGKIIFSGITPGGFKETNGLIFSAIFLTKVEGKGTITINQSQALINDGLGTPAAVSISDLPFSVVIEPKTTTPEPGKIIDNELPEQFKPEIASSQDIFDGKNFLVFATKDKGSGIAKYEVREYRQKLFSFFTPWKEAVSPYLLTDQKLKSYIFVKAIDLSGNERIEEIAPRFALAWYENYLVYVIILISLIVLLMLWKASRRKKNQKITEVKNT